MYLKLSVVFSYLEATASSRCFVEGEAVLEAEHVILCGVRQKDGVLWSLTAFCLQSSTLKKDPHEISGTLKVNNCVEIQKFVCSCAAGASGQCKHIAATLLFCTRKPLEDLEELSSTDTSCLWKNKKPRLDSKYLPQPLKKTPCFKAMMTRKKPITLSPEEVKELFENISTVAPNCAVSLHRKGRRQNIEQDKAVEIPQYVLKVLNNSQESLFMHNLDINYSVNNNCCKKILVSFKNDNVVEGLCCNQGSLKWKKFRKNRITGSTCHTVYTFKKKIWTTMLKNFFSRKDVTTKEMTHGKYQEEFALAAFQNQNPAYNIKSLGILICEKYPWIAYSPDGVIFEEDKPTRLLEIKCPYLGKSKSIEEVVNGLSYLSDDHKLKETHSYYFQVQLGMAVLNVNICDFVIYCSKDQSYLHIIIPFDERFAANLIETVSSKYLNKMIHYICESDAMESNGVE